MKKIISLIALFAILNQSVIQAQIQTHNFNYTVNVKATIEKIVCVNAYDGSSDKTEEIYGEIKVIPGYVCFDVDTGEDHPPVNYSGIGKWELKPNQYHRMKKGDVLPINYTRSWTYYFPPKCDKDPSHQTVVRCQSNLDERDMPHDPDDKLNEPCGGACFNDVYLNQVKQQGEKTFQFQQRHESGGSKFVVHFRIETVTTYQSSKSEELELQLLMKKYEDIETRLNNADNLKEAQQKSLVNESIQLREKFTAYLNAKPNNGGGKKPKSTIKCAEDCHRFYKNCLKISSQSLCSEITKWCQFSCTHGSFTQ